MVSVDFLDNDAIVRALLFSKSVFLTDSGVESRPTPGCFWRFLRLRVVTGCEMYPGVDGYNLMDTHRNVIELPLRSPHFEYVECGSKIVDARICFGKYRGLQAGDVVKFVKSRQKFILKKLTSIELYDNFGHLLRTEGHQNFFLISGRR